ncbi:MAG TPA: FUSC family protein [Planktothrix sp. UBA8402]|nr:FUSC family protein [Planktothrix sp. UBA8402]
MAGTWTIVLCLGIWPLNPYISLKKSISECYQALVKYINQAKNISESEELKQVSQLRETLENARRAWTLDRKLILGNTSLGESAIILIQDADNLITSIVTLTELVQLHQHDPQFFTVRILVDNALEEIALFCKNLVKLLWNKSVSVDTDHLKRIVTAIAQQKQLQQQTIADHAEDYPALVVIERIVSTLESIIIQLDCTTLTGNQIRNNQSINHLQKNRILSPESEILSAVKITSWFDTLRDNFTFDSSFFRHGLRLSIMTTIGVAIYSIAELPQGNWLTLTILVVLQPSFGNTFQRFFHRMLGTILGAIITPIFWILIPSQLILEIINLSSIVIGFALIPFHYGLAVFFISIFAIGAEMSRQGGNWQVAMIRFLWTCVGAALAFVGAFLLFRPNEKEQLSVKLARAIAASLDYFNAVISVYLGIVPYDLNLLIKQRQKTRLAYFNAQAALQQLSSDPNTSAADIEPRMALLIYLHRFSRSVSVLLAQLEHFSGTEPHPELATFVEQVNQFFLPLISAILTGTLPPTLPTFEPSIQAIQTHLQALQVTRVQEFATDQDYTPTRQILKDYTILGIELNQMLNSLNSIDSTVVRLIPLGLTQKPGF